MVGADPRLSGGSELLNASPQRPLTLGPGQAPQPDCATLHQRFDSALCPDSRPDAASQPASTPLRASDLRICQRRMAGGRGTAPADPHDTSLEEFAEKPLLARQADDMCGASPFIAVLLPSQPCGPCSADWVFSRRLNNARLDDPARFAECPRMTGTARKTRDATGHMSRSSPHAEHCGSSRRSIGDLGAVAGWAQALERLCGINRPLTCRCRSG